MYCFCDTSNFQICIVFNYEPNASQLNGNNFFLFTDKFYFKNFVLRGSKDRMINIVKDCIKDKSIQFIDVKNQNIRKFNDARSTFHQVIGPSKELVFKKLRQCSRENLQFNFRLDNNPGNWFSTSMYDYYCFA